MAKQTKTAAPKGSGTPRIEAPAGSDDVRPPALPDVISADAPLFTVSVAARLAGMHPQTLRTYDRLGLVTPQRTKGAGRRYSPRDVGKLRLIQHLSQDEGINLAGVQRIIELSNQLDDLNRRCAQLTELVQLLTAGLDGVDGPASRVFTAGSSGDVWPGRTQHRPRELTAAGE